MQFVKFRLPARLLPPTDLVIGMHHRRGIYGRDESYSNSYFTFLFDLLGASFGGQRAMEVPKAWSGRDFRSGEFKLAKLVFNELVVWVCCVCV